MMTEAEKRRRELLETVARRVRERWTGDDAHTVERFVGLYYQGTDPGDVAARDPQDLYGAALSHWNLGASRRRGQNLIHVYNPNPEQHGWESTHTIVEVVTDDRPFLVDSVSIALNRLGLTIHLIIHPVLTVRRNRGRLQDLADESDMQRGANEAWMHFEVDRQADPEMLEQIREEVASVLGDVRAAVEDWQEMRGRLEAVIGEVQSHPPPVDPELVSEVTAFLEWVRDDHFTLLAYRTYELVASSGQDRLVPVADSGLGLMRNAPTDKYSTSFAALPDSVRRLARDPDPLVLTKSNSRATVHRPGYMDYIGVKRYDGQGNVVGEHRFLGLFTSAAYHRSPRNIPLLRRKIEAVLERAKLRPNSHAGKALINILETHPRDEIFQSSVEELYDVARGILHLQERQRVRLFVRYDTYRRFVSCLVFAPRERYNTDVRERMQALLQQAFGGSHSEFSVQLSESVLARIHFIVRLPEPGEPDYDHADLEQRLADTMRSWCDDLHRALVDRFGEEAGNRHYQRYGAGFGAAYREDTSPRTAAQDVERLEQLKQAGDLSISLYRPLEAQPGLLRFRLYQAGESIILSDVLPVLENMGVRVVDEHPYEVTRDSGPICWVHDFGLLYGAAGQLEAERVRDSFQEAFAAIWRNHAEDDGFNRLVLAADLPWRDIVILRALSRFLRQVGTQYSEAYVQETLASHPRISHLLVHLFHARFDPQNANAERAERLSGQIEGLLDEVASLDQDRILRRFLSVIQACVRSNFFRPGENGAPREFLSFKIHSESIPGMPKPVPAVEIFVYSPRVEGVHLRGGKVARGGLRWSDRREDFRTEVLGLMKAQMVKNALIVPVGAKGGFVCKRLPEDRAAQAEEVQSCYRTFICALLDLTDNLADGEVQPPPQVVRHDEDDPYLVVAADKGTASFSDLANSVAEEYGFWLRDAFASGGSTGYDHKKMGITAKGTWEAVKRHFREMGRDTQSEPFTVVGIGDMSGDVFGNGMLLSRHIRLLAAFDHRHIFLDPDPDPEASYQERERLFHAGRTTWEDYSSKLISKGGGVFPRTAKSIALSPQVRNALDIAEERLTPLELISAILRAPVDLLWNGGIGTYVKSAEETHADVGDKANDPLRVDAEDLRCKVVGEGGNLGITQLARMAFSRRGGRINSDAIDNSGGVDCSDHEVNIKILLNRVIDEGELTEKHRNQLLARMTDEVSTLVLHNNYRQTQALTLAQADAAERLGEQIQFMRTLEREGRLDRPVEQLSDDETLAELVRSGQGLSRPELAVLLAYAKLRAYDALLDSDLVEQPFLAGELQDYFPGPLRERFAEQVSAHPLRKEILATTVTNHVVHRMGSTFLFRTRDITGSSAPVVARAYFAGRDIYGLRALWHEVDALDNQVPAELQTRMLLAICQLQDRATLWLLRNLPSPIPVEETVQNIAPVVEELSRRLEEILPDTDRQRLQRAAAEFRDQGVPEQLAARIADLDMLYSALDLVRVSTETGADLDTASRCYFGAVTRLGLDWLRDALAGYTPADSWQERYRAGLEDEFFVQLRVLAVRILSHTEAEGAERLERWIKGTAALVERLARTLQELRSADSLTLPMLGVGLQEMRNLAQAGAAEHLVSERPPEPE